MKSSVLLVRLVLQSFVTLLLVSALGPFSIAIFCDPSFSFGVLQDEAARVALCDNQHWLPVVVLLGLVSCSVPPVLKAELLLTLAAFAKSPEISASLWQSIEVSQVR